VVELTRLAQEWGRPKTLKEDNVLPDYAGTSASLSRR
jgi:hypothetical protein